MLVPSAFYLAARVLRRLGWWLVPGVNELRCKDPSGRERELRAGRETFEGVTYWLRLHYRRLYLNKTQD